MSVLGAAVLIGGAFALTRKKSTSNTFGDVVRGERARRQAAIDAENERLKRVEARRVSERGKLLQRETEAKEELGGITLEAGEAIDAQLTELTNQVGFNAGEAKQIVAGRTSERGLLRSSFAGEQFGGVERRALEQGLRLRSRAEQQKLSISDTVKKSLNAIADQRADLEARITQATRISDLNIAEGFNIQRIKDDFETQVTTLQIDAANKAAIIGSVNSLLADLTEIGIRSSGEQ